MHDDDVEGVVGGCAAARPASEVGRGRAGRRTRVVVEERVSSRLEQWTTAAIVVDVGREKAGGSVCVYFRVSIVFVVALVVWCCNWGPVRLVVVDVGWSRDALTNGSIDALCSFFFSRASQILAAQSTNQSPRNTATVANREKRRKCGSNCPCGAPGEYPLKKIIKHAGGFFCVIPSFLPFSFLSCLKKKRTH